VLRLVSWLRASRSGHVSQKKRSEGTLMNFSKLFRYFLAVCAETDIIRVCGELDGPLSG